MKRWVQLLLVAVIIDIALALVVRVDEVRLFNAGDRSAPTLVAVFGLAWLFVVAIAAVGTGRAMFRASRDLARNGGALAAVAGTTREWMWEADPDLQLTYCSERVGEQLGYRPEQLLGRAMPTLMTPEDEARAREVLAECVRTDTGWTDLEFTWQHADGHHVLMQGSGVPIHDESGRLVGFRGARRAVTDAMTAERDAVAARQRLAVVLSEGTVDIALQPIVSLTTGRLAGAEALARFADGRGPDQWFADARATGMDLELDRIAFFKALDRLAELPPQCYLSINASPGLITDSSLAERLVSRGDVPLDRLVIEITEHVEVGRYEDLHAALNPLRKLGVRLAIDDTGAGYASFNHVLQLRPDMIKVDRSLVANLAADPARRSLITAMTLLARELGASVTAEGVETRNELVALKALGVDSAQGYLLSHPSTEPHRWRTWSNQTWKQVSPPAPVRRESKFAGARG